MDKTVTLIVAVTILMLTAAIVSFIGSGQLTNFNNDTSRVSGQGCEYQWEEWENSDQEDLSMINAKCMKGKYAKEAGVSERAAELCGGGVSIPGIC